MPRLDRIYTRTGDDGSTALGGGQRVPKDALRIEAYGTVDELNATLGMAVAAGPDESLRAPLETIQNDLFHLGSDLCFLEADKQAYRIPQIEERHVVALEARIDALTDALPPLANFVLPGGTPAAAALHLARTVCRRAERITLTLSREEPVGPWVIRYLNRLSDALFVMARHDNVRHGGEPAVWNSRA